jgi:hypothetical protein
MRQLFLSAVAAGLMFGVTLPASTAANAAPAAAAAIATPESGVESVRYMRQSHYRRRAMHRRSAYRGRVSRRARAPSQAGNARNPERPVYQQQQGQTTGGPRY